jgi:Protein of unknown function (DUF3606)
MADDRTKKRPQDANRINLSKNYEVRYWTEELGVSEAMLRQLVERHGPIATKIRRQLGK